MNHFFAKTFHKKTNPDFKFFADASIATKNKSYPRLTSIKLPLNFKELGSLESSLEKRSSTREFIKSDLNLLDLSTLLKKAAGSREKNKRTYPSPGGKNSLEVYVAVQIPLSDLSLGLYHYNVTDHSLEVLIEGEHIDQVTKCFKYEWAQKAPLVIVITTSIDRLSSKYGDFGYRLALLEAGHLSQNLELVSESLHLKHCVMSGLMNEELDKILDLDETEEMSMVSIVIGK